MAIKINGTNTAAAPGITGDDTDTGLVYGTNQVDISTGGSSRVTVDSSGNVGIGTTSPSEKLDVEGTIECLNELRSKTGNDLKLNAGSVNRDVFLQVNDTTLMTLKGDGSKVGIGTTSPSNRFHVNGPSGEDLSIFQTATTGNSNVGMIVFKDGGDTYCGQITSNPNSHTTSFVTNSDYRLKENEVAITDGITRVKQFKPYRFDWKKSGKTVDGFFAHEAQTVVPESIIGTKDETEDILYVAEDTIPEGKSIGDIKETVPKYQGIDQSKLVPLLTAALQEAITKIETLETKVAALEAHTHE